jgi:hypothetical protein
MHHDALLGIQTGRHGHRQGHGSQHQHHKRRVREAFALQQPRRHVQERSTHQKRDGKVDDERMQILQVLRSGEHGRYSTDSTVT